MIAYDNGQAERRGVPALRALLRGSIYDLALLPLTSGWYRSVLERVSVGARLLDVGVGTGSALGCNADLIRERELQVTAIDIDGDYLQRCARAIEKAGLESRVRIHLEPLLQHRAGRYEAVYFSASFMLMEDPLAALEHARELLEPEGRIFFTQTFHERGTRWEEWKPRLRALTTIDFGRVTYEEDFRALVEAAGLEMQELETLRNGRSRSYRLAVARRRETEVAAPPALSDG